MDIRFDKTDLDYEGDCFSPYGGGHVTVTVTAWCDDEKVLVRESLPVGAVGGPDWPQIVNEMRAELVYEIMKRHPSTDFTINQQ